MAKYTVEVRTLMENQEAMAAIRAAFDACHIYQPAKPHALIPTQEDFIQRFLKRYKYREIGCETFGEWVDRLEIEIGDKMPLVNEILRTVETMANIDDIFGNVDIEETFEQTVQDDSTTQGNTSNTQSGAASQSGTNSQTDNLTQNGTSTMENNGTQDDESSSTSKVVGSGNDNTTNNQTVNGKHVKSDTPQSALSITAQDIDGLTYASEAQWDKDTTNGTTATESTTTTDTEDAGTSKRTTSETATGETSNTEQRTAQGTTASETTTQNTEAGTSNIVATSTKVLSYVHKKVGNQGVNTYAHDMKEFRTAIIDPLDVYLFKNEDIEQLFMQLY